MNPMKYVPQRIIFWVLLFTANANATSPCPPIPLVPLLNLSDPEWVVAQVTIAEQPFPDFGPPFGLTSVYVDRVFAGKLDSKTVVVKDNQGILNCGGATLPNLEDDVGSSWLLGMRGPNEDGTYGGIFALTVLGIEEDLILDPILGFQALGENRTLDELAVFVDTLAPRIDTPHYQISMSPRLPGPSDVVSVDLVGKDGFCLDSVRTNAIMLDSANAALKVSFLPEGSESEDCGYRPPASIELFSLPRPQEQDFFTISFYEEEETKNALPFRSTNLIAELEYPLRTSPSTEAFAEVPEQGSVQSGIGIIRGWACEAQRVDIQFDELPRMQLPYGMVRTDTRPVCGDSNNGYGLVYAWGLLGQGQHTMRTYIDGNLVDTVDFEVGGLENAFITGAEASYDLNNFPGPGQSVTVQWSEAAQNFIIVATLILYHFR